MTDDRQALEDLEIDLLLEGVFRRFGHDFRGFLRESVRQRLHGLMRQCGASTVSSLQDRVMHDEQAAQSLLLALSPPAASLFDDPAYFAALRAAIVPWLRSSPSPRVWVAECASAEDVFGLEILLEEEGLHDRTQVFATAANEALLRQASAGSFPAERMQEYTDNYRASGGTAYLAKYCNEHDGRMMFSAHLRSNITWAQYSLATDASFNEFQLIVCRRALSTFGSTLHRRALQLFYDSMPLFGILGVDSNERLGTSTFESRYKSISNHPGLYRRVA